MQRTRLLDTPIEPRKRSVYYQFHAAARRSFGISGPARRTGGEHGGRAAGRSPLASNHPNPSDSRGLEIMMMD